MNKRVAVALSGGVDSAVSALLLKEQGYEVVGLTGKMTCSEDFDLVIKNAERVAKKLEIPFYPLDVSSEFNKKVIEYFENAYKEGKTPNPCIMCNKFIKWGALYDYAINEINADYVATGHYARIKDCDGIYKLYPASDEHKDQLYFLFMLSQEHLERTIFPLSRYKKDEIKELAVKYNLPPKSSKESQDICFIKHPMTTKKYLQNVFGEEGKGNFVDCETGKILGKHDGFWQYTIGQRKGIGIAAPEALYVTGIDSVSNTVFVGYKDKLYSDFIELDSIIWNYDISETDFDAMVKIRYNMSAVKSRIVKIEKGWKVEFEKPISAITKGQACVIYDINDGHLLGGGWI